MASQRIFIWSALALVLWLNYQAWMHDYHPPRPTRAGNDRPFRCSFKASGARPRRNRALAARAHRVLQPERQALRATLTVPTPPTEAAPQGSSAGKIHVRTDVLDMDISLQGGQLTTCGSAWVPRSQEPARDKGPPVQRCAGGAALFVLQSGLTMEGERSATGSPRDLYRAGIRAHARPWAGRAENPAHVEQRRRSHGHRDLYTPARQLRSYTSTTQFNNSEPCSVERRFVPAASAPAAQGRTLDVHTSRATRLPAPRSTTARAIGSSRSTMRKTASSMRRLRWLAGVDAAPFCGGSCAYGEA